MTYDEQTGLRKIPEVTLLFWIIKIAATTLGETGGDAVTMSLHTGYLIGSVIFTGIFIVAVSVQIIARRCHAFLYWVVIVATTTAGTTLADFADRSMGIGYAGGSAVLLVLLMLSLGIWYLSMGSVATAAVTAPRVEIFYWMTIMLSQTLGTALGDWVADTTGLGYERGALVFAAGLTCVAAAHFYTRASPTLLFWAAFILTRPLGATLGDLLDKPVSHGGLAWSRFTASAVLALFVTLCLLIFPQRTGSRLGQAGNRP